MTDKVTEFLRKDVNVQVTSNGVRFTKKNDGKIFDEKILDEKICDEKIS